MNTAIYEEGYKAASQGVDFDDNPYSLPWRRADWRRGWKAYQPSPVTARAPMVVGDSNAGIVEEDDYSALAAAFSGIDSWQPHIAAPNALDIKPVWSRASEPLPASTPISTFDPADVAGDWTRGGSSSYSTTDSDSSSSRASSFSTSGSDSSGSYSTSSSDSSSYSSSSDSGGSFSSSDSL